ncbi:hypothetical protein LRP88_01687 [Fusarium phalaenopsidis]
MEKAGFPASKAEIEDAANTLRRRRDPEAKPVGKSWYATFREDHPELQKTFLKAVDKSRFKKSSIFPPNPDPAVAFLLRQQIKAKKAVNPAFASLLPSDTRFQRASDTAKRVTEEYLDIFSSLTRAGLQEVRKVVIEAVLLEEIVTMYMDDRRSRIEKRYNQMKRGKRAKPVGDFTHSVSLQDLRDQQAEVIAADREKENRRQIRSVRSVLLREIERLKEEWRDNKEVVVDGVKKKLQFKKWLKHTGKDKDYLSMDTQHTELPQEVRDSIREATHAAKPLSAMDWTALPGSDDTVTFNLEPPRQAEEDDEDDEEEEEDLPLIEITTLHEERATPRWQRSSPPMTPSYESSPPPEEASTPCPSRPQPHTSALDQILEIIRREREVQSASLPRSIDVDTP